MRIKLILVLLLGISLLAAVEIPVAESAVPISVSLTGFVENPGVYQLSPLNRLSDLLKMEQIYSLEAMQQLNLPENTVPETKLLTPQAPINEEDIPKIDYKKLQALRSIQIIRAGKALTYDLLRFNRLGETENNPYLKDGDVVVISAIKDFIYTGGAINLPGEMEYVEGDKLGDIISLAKGLSFDADPDKIQLYRYTSNRIDFEVKILNLKQDKSLENYTLQADDRIIIPGDSEIRTRKRVKISGQVKNPGEYIIDASTTLYEVVMLAGGLTKYGDANSLLYYNNNLNTETDYYLEMLMQRSMSDMTPLEYSYLRTNLMQLKGKYSIDAQKLFASNGQEANPILHDGDRIFIPELMNIVWVSGQVRHPGMVPWVEGKDWDYYISAAGGYANNRKVGKGRLIRGQSGNWVTPKKNMTIMPGDTVFVPSQIDRALWTDVKDIVTLTSSMITIIIGLRALTTK